MEVIKVSLAYVNVAMGTVKHWLHLFTEPNMLWSSNLEAGGLLLVFTCTFTVVLLSVFVPLSFWTADAASM